MNNTSTIGFELAQMVDAALSTSRSKSIMCGRFAALDQEQMQAIMSLLGTYHGSHCFSEEISRGLVWLNGGTIRKFCVPRQDHDIVPVFGITLEAFPATTGSGILVVQGFPPTFTTRTDLEQLITLATVKRDDGTRGPAADATSVTSELLNVFQEDAWAFVSTDQVMKLVDAAIADAKILANTQGHDLDQEFMLRVCNNWEVTPRPESSMLLDYVARREAVILRAAPYYVAYVVPSDADMWFVYVFDAYQRKDTWGSPLREFFDRLRSFEPEQVASESPSNEGESQLGSSAA